MAAYRITIILKDKTIKGIRELDQEDVDTAWQVFYAAAVHAYSTLKLLDFEVVKISSFSNDYRQWKLSRKKVIDDGKNVNKRKNKS